MSIEIVSSFGREGYKTYGRSFITSLEKYLPRDITVSLYPEWDVEIPHRDNWEFRNLLNLPDVARTLTFLDDPIYRGSEQSNKHAWKPRDIERGYNFRFDAHKFCRKVFAVHHAMSVTRAKKLFWLDADTAALVDVPHAVFDVALPNGCDISRLYRGAEYHSECGFIGIAVNAATNNFVTKFKELYRTGKFVNYKEWHDSFLFDRLIEETPSLKIHNIPHESSSQPFDYSVIGKYMTHLKGPRKDKGVNEQALKDFHDRRSRN